MSTILSTVETGTAGHLLFLCSKPQKTYFMDWFGRIQIVGSVIKLYVKDQLALSLPFYFIYEGVCFNDWIFYLFKKNYDDIISEHWYTYF